MPPPAITGLFSESRREPVISQSQRHETVVDGVDLIHRSLIATDLEPAFHLISDLERAEVFKLVQWVLL